MLVVPSTWAARGWAARKLHFGPSHASATRILSGIDYHPSATLVRRSSGPQHTRGRRADLLTFPATIATSVDR